MTTMDRIHLHTHSHAADLRGQPCEKEWLQALEVSE